MYVILLNSHTVRRPTHTCVFVFDQSNYHKKYDEHALLANNILVKDGGEQRVRDTTWAERPQVMVNGDGECWWNNKGPENYSSGERDK